LITFSSGNKPTSTISSIQQRLLSASSSTKLSLAMISAVDLPRQAQYGSVKIKTFCQSQFF
jgi:hypothetical protein